MRFERFSGFMELFSLRKIRWVCPRHRGPGPPAPAHRSMDFIKRWLLATGSTAQIKPIESVSLLWCLYSIWRWVAIVSSQLMQESPDANLMTEAAGYGRGGISSCSRQRVAVERGGSPEFEFSRATVVVFRWGLLLRDHRDEGNVFMLTLIDRERQRSPATVRRLDRCLSTVRAASGEASAPGTRAKASLSSLLASRLTNCSDRRRRTQIWWLPRVRRVLDLRPKIRTICGAIYRFF
jgi:hypothetical protein